MQSVYLQVGISLQCAWRPLVELAVSDTDRSKAACGHARLSFSVWIEQLCFLSHAKDEGLFLPESMVTKEEHANTMECFQACYMWSARRVLNRTSQSPHL